MSLAALALFVSGSAIAQDVGVLGAPMDPGLNQDVREMLMCTGDFASAAAVDVSASTPSLVELDAFDAVLVYSELPFADPAALGDALADYLEQGHGVVLAVGAFATGTVLEGRFVADGYLPVTTGALTAPGGDLGHAIVPAYYWLPGQVRGHDSVYGVDRFDGGALSLQVSGITAVAPAYTTMEWTNGALMTVVREGSGGVGRSVAVNVFPRGAVTDYLPSDWVGDGDRIFASALDWALGIDRVQGCAQTETTQDFNCNGADVADEPPIDLSDPTCTDVDPWTGEPAANNDYYFDYGTWGCRFFTAGDDIDPNEGMSPIHGDLYVGNDPSNVRDATICDGPSVGSLAVDDDGDGHAEDENGNGVTGEVDPPTLFEDCDDGDPALNAETGTCCALGTITLLGASVVTLSCDNCPYEYNPDQVDRDCDGVGDLCDNCPSVANSDQANADGDCHGDACDDCPDAADADQADRDRDGVGDACDLCPDAADPGEPDSDSCPAALGNSDGIPDACDTCPDLCDPDQADGDGDGAGDACDDCPLVGDAAQSDLDGDGTGDACDACPLLPVVDASGGHDHSDPDLDGLGNACDNCPDYQNPTQADADRDGRGDDCDNCPSVANSDQSDADGDHLGDACDTAPNTPYGATPGDEGATGTPIAIPDDGRGCGCGSTGNPADVAASAGLALASLLLLRRRR